MYTVLIITMLTMLTLLYFYYDRYDFLYNLLSGIIGMMLGFVCGFIIALLLPNKTEVVKTTYYLESLNDNNSINGSFFLGSGQFNGAMMYTYYYKDGDFYKMAQLYYKDAKIKYTENKPRIEITEVKAKDDVFLNNFSINNNYSIEYIIYIPEGSIKQNYILDGQ